MPENLNVLNFILSFNILYDTTFRGKDERLIMGCVYPLLDSRSVSAVTEHVHATIGHLLLGNGAVNPSQGYIHTARIRIGLSSGGSSPK